MSTPQKNPFQGFVPIPSSIPDPNTITLQKLELYNSFEQQRTNANFNVLKKSRLWMAGVFGLIALAGFFGEKRAHEELFGCDYKGGVYLDLKTIRDEQHYSYNREFQRMFHLSEGLVPDQRVHSPDLLADLGIQEQRGGKPNIPKRAAHEKYY